MDVAVQHLTLCRIIAGGTPFAWGGRTIDTARKWLDSNALYGGVYGTVVTSALLAALDHQPGTYSPGYDAEWIFITVVIAAVTRGYAKHISTHQAGGPTHQLWRDLLDDVLSGVPIVAACLPTLVVLLVAGLSGWAGEAYTTTALALNVVLLIGWGLAAARLGGYRWRGAVLISAAHAVLGLLVIFLNILIK
ncbi:hypothetical protein GCM10009765_73360 [Fodinicola feengrottensis]|uniref:Yip1 domain-containing protein n=1 Tax=Fodinicola feengrottensis TaxID=435914 RepID=A0ABN2IX70_9ACTN